MAVEADSAPAVACPTAPAVAESPAGRGKASDRGLPGGLVGGVGPNHPRGGGLPNGPRSEGPPNGLRGGAAERISGGQLAWW